MKNKFALRTQLSVRNDFRPWNFSSVVKRILLFTAGESLRLLEWLTLGQSETSLGELMMSRRFEPVGFAKHGYGYPKDPNSSSETIVLGVTYEFYWSLEIEGGRYKLGVRESEDGPVILLYVSTDPNASPRAVSYRWGEVHWLVSVYPLDHTSWGNHRAQHVVQFTVTNPESPDLPSHGEPVPAQTDN